MKENRRATIVLITLFTVILIAGLSLQTVLAAAPFLRLPSTPVNGTYGPVPGANSYFDITLSNVSTGFDVSNGVYPAWCIQYDSTNSLNDGSIMLYSSYDPNMPNDVKILDWNKINYVLNHKQGSIDEVQFAIWFILGEFGGPFSSATQAMINSANANPTYEPGPGEIIAVIVYSDGMGTDPSNIQEAIIEVLVPDLDFGDLSSNYSMTTLAQDGARHLPGDIYLGTLKDAESDGFPSAEANGDDLNNLDDEDGIVPIANAPAYWTQGQGTVQVTVTGGAGCLFAWMDAWDSNTNTPGTDGDFSDSGTGWSEAIIVNEPVSAGTQQVSFALPENAAKYPLWARFRLAPAVEGSCSFYDTNPVTTHGLIENGEVEDYYFNFSPTAVSLQSFTAQATGVNRNMISLAVVVLLAAGMLLGSRILAVRQLHGS